MLTIPRTKTYYRYLLSYVALLCTVVIALFAFSQIFFLVQIRQSLMDTHRSRLRQTVQQLDNELQQIYAIDYQISTANANFLSFYFSDPSPMRDLRIVNEFKNLLAPSTFISEIALVEQNDDYVYTSKAVYAKRLFFDTIFSFDEWSDPISDLSALSGRIVRPAERVNGAQRYITFINLPSVFSRLQQSVQLYFVEEQQFLSRLSPESAPTQQGMIWDDQGNLIVSTLPLSAPVTGSSLSLDGVRYLLISEPSTVMNWTYTFLLPEDEYLAPIHRAQMMLLMFLLFVLGLGSLLIHYAMKVNYKPIQALTQALGVAHQGDELESLRDAVNALTQRNDHHPTHLTSVPDRQALKDTLLFLLLKGKFTSFDDFNSEAQALDMTFDKPCYQVLMLRHFGQEQEVPRTALASALDCALGNGYIYHFRDLFEPSMIVCLVGMEEGTSNDLADRCRHLLTLCAQEYGFSFTIGMSECYQDIRHMSAACFEATQAVREYFVRGQHQLIAYRELRHTLDSQADPLAELRNLSEQTPQQQMQTVHRFMDALKEQKVPSLMAKSYCNLAVQMLMTSTAPISMDDLFTISYLRTADDYLAFMLHMLHKEPETLLPESTEQMPELLQRISAYMAENYDDCNFSIQDAADKLGLSSSYLSQYFKQQTGETLTSYIASLRIRKACSLLETTTMPLQMVSESVGYYNENSFIRRFKQMTGVTPGEYRKIHR